MLGSLASSYRALFPAEDAVYARLRGFLDETPAPMSRHSVSGHVTATGIVVEGSKVLSIRHPVLGLLLCPGGHIEGVEMPWEAALRETLEETGLGVSIDPWHKGHFCPIDIDIHTIPANEKKCEPTHTHYDFRYLFRLNGNVIGDPELEVVWAPVDDLDPSLARAVNKAMNLLT